MSDLAIANSYEESVGSCVPPTPTTPPHPASAGPRSASVRRQLDFTVGGDLEDDDDELLCRLMDDIERGYSEDEAKRRAPPCICGRGVCAVEREKCGRLKYVCPSWPKCKHVAFCEEVDLNPQTQPTPRSHPKPSNPCAFNDPSNHMAGPRTPVNVCPQVTGATTPVNVHPQVAGATALFIDSPQGAATLAKFIPQGEGITNQGAGATTRGKVSFQGAKLNGERPLCQCTAGKCIKSRVDNEDYYVCPIPKGKGACSYKVLVRDVVKDTPSADVLHQPIAAVNTPSKSPMRPYGTPSPISPNSNDVCYGCKEKGHWKRDCPKRQSPTPGACFECGMVGHWRPDCPQLKGS